MSVDGVGLEETYYHELVREFCTVILFVVYMARLRWSVEDFRFHIRECNKHDNFSVVLCSYCFIELFNDDRIRVAVEVEANI